MKYCLAEACENTFIIFDCLHQSYASKDYFLCAHKKLLEQQRDDALILVKEMISEGNFFVKMLVLGQDGTLGEFCGNGARACAAYLYAKFPFLKRFYLKTYSGIHPLKKYENHTYSVKLPPASFELNTKYITDALLFKKTYDFSYVEILEPHLVLQSEMSKEELFALGRQINANKALFPFGINVNTWYPKEDGTIFVQTYERGVQRLTKSCGTGSICCAAYHKNRDQVFVSTSGGKLTITFDKEGVELKGAAFFF